MSRLPFTVRPFTVRQILGTVVLFATAVLLANTFVALGWLQPIVVAGDSMAPHYSSQEPLLIRRWVGPIERWDVVVARSPLDANVQVIKRVVGLPGERLTIREGDIWIDDRRVVKSPAEQMRLRLPVEMPNNLHLATLTMASVRDSLPTNDRISRRLNRVEDLMIETELHCEERATWSVQLADRFRVEIAGSGEIRLLDNNGRCLERTTLARPSPWKVVISSLDHAALLMVDGRAIISRTPIVGLERGVETQTAIKVSSDGLLEMRELSIWRDVYYEAMPVIGSPAIGPREATWQLGPQDYFVVGDNQAISLDSRHSGGVPRRLIEGIVR